MSIDAISFLPAVSEPSLAPLAQQAIPTGQFAGWFADQMTSVNAQLAQADRSVQALAAGESANLHEVMIHLEEAKLSLQLLMQVRTQVLEAYQQVMQSPL